MTLKNSNNLSIVENPQLVRLFGLILLLSFGFNCQAEDWRSRISNELIKKWHFLSGKETASTQLSFSGIGDDYQLPTCQHSPEVRTVRPLQPGRNGIEVSCGSPYWRQHFAVSLHVYEHIVILTQPLRDKQALSPAMVRLVRQDIGELNKGYFTSLNEVIGLIGKRRLNRGTVLSPDMVQLPLLIKRGEKVAIRINRPGIKVEMEGTAMGAGHKGEQIRVRNRQSQKVISATVVARGLVQVE